MRKNEKKNRKESTKKKCFERWLQQEDEVK